MAQDDAGEPTEAPGPVVVESFDDARAPGTWMQDARQRWMRVAFDPGSSIDLGVSSGLDATARDGAVEPAFDAVLGAHYRAFLVWGEGESLVSWQLDHAFAAGRVGLLALGDSLPAVDIVAYRGEFLRHDELPHITVPGEPPRRLPFPFDIGIETESLRVITGPWPSVGGFDDQDGSPAELLRLGVAQAAVLLDPWRTGRPGDSLEIGLGARYDIDFVFRPDADSTNAAATDALADEVVHRLAPLTELSVRWRWQDGPGLTRIDTRAAIRPMWNTRDAWFFVADVQASVERILIAINDEPLAVRATARYTHDTHALRDDAFDQFVVRAGLVWRFQLR